MRESVNLMTYTIEPILKQLYKHSRKLNDRKQTKVGHRGPRSNSRTNQGGNPNTRPCVSKDMRR